MDFMHLYRYDDQQVTYWNRKDTYQLYGTDTEGNYYFFLRDMAHMLADTHSCFDVQWNAKESIAALKSGMAYTGDTVHLDWWGVAVMGTKPNIPLLINGEKVTLTDYIGKGKLGSMPYLVQLNDDLLAVLWEEYSYTEDGDTVDDGLRYCFVDGNGNRLGKVQAAPDKQLSIDCQPLYIGGKLLWFTDRSSICSFYSIEVPYATDTNDTATETTARPKSSMPVRH